jgi:hypothetical protein
MASVHSTLGSLRLPVLVATVGVLVLTVNPVRGQSQSRDHQIDPGQRNPTHSSQLPDWAEPSVGASARESQRTDGSSLPGSIEQPQPKAPPPGGEPVPVDGGLALLAAAGAGYAVRRLNQDDEKDDDPA